MTDRELLEFAAKAAGMWKDHFCLDEEDYPIFHEVKGFYLAWGSDWWNPITDDGDALRLAVKLRLVIHVWDEGNAVSTAKTLPSGDDPDDESNDWHIAYAPSCEGLHLAARLSIVRAAAKIGKAMP